MKEETTIFNSQNNNIGFNSDLYDKNSIVLVNLNKLPPNYISNGFVTEKECTISYSWIVKNRKEVFESVYNLGREIYNTFYKSSNSEHKLSYFSYDILSDQNDKNKLMVLFNNFVKENGYPYLIKNLEFLGIKSLFIPKYSEFLDECMDLYIIEELRKWITKTKNNTNTGYKTNKEGTTFTIPVQRFKSLYELFSLKLISWTAHTSDTIFDDHYSKESILNVLDLGLPFSSAVNDNDHFILARFTDYLHRSLIYYLLTKVFGKNFGQHNITKSIPIFNSTSNEYRLYTTAFSQIGIAYDYLLNNLTATKIGTTRAICEMPECNNEFEKINKSNFCTAHKDEEIRKYINHKYYIKHKKRSY